jgi:hypothetical protein
MNDQQETIEELLQLAMKSEFDSKYKNETRLAFFFCRNAEKDLGIEIDNCKKNSNPNSAPDIYITLSDKTNINLEVTALSDESVEEKNSFFQKKVEAIAKLIIRQNLELLPKGAYSFYYLPCTNKYKIGSEQIKNQLILKIPELFKKYQEIGSRYCFIEDKKGNRIGEIHISKFSDIEERKYFLFPQSFERFAEWTDKELQIKIQNITNKKEKKYANNIIPKNHNRNEWWLLISDINGIMNTQNANFDLSNLEITSSYFSRIFLIQNISTDNSLYRVIEFKVN